MEENIKPTVCIDEIVFDGQTEQGVELDHVLPDYCPDIFKVLSCTLTPCILSYNVSADCRLSIDGIVYIKVLYLTENSNNVQCIDQRYTYSKTVDMGRRNMPDAAPVVTLRTKADYCSCRAVSPRRIDIRGAVSVRIRAASCAEYPLPAIPDGLQVKKTEINGCGKTLFAQKQITVREEIDTGAGGITFVMLSNAVPKITDLRVIADKAVLKGVVTVNALYGTPDGEKPENAGAAGSEKMTADIPISAILDIDGITSSHRTFPEITVMNCELIPKAEGGILSCDLLCECRARAQLEENIEIATDVYSTEYETEFASEMLKISTLPRTVSHNFTVRTDMPADKGEIRSVWDAQGELTNPVLRPNENGELVLSGTLCTRVYGAMTDGVPFFSEKQEPIEQAIPADDVLPDTLSEFNAVCSDAGFSIRPDGSLEITCTVELSAYLHNINPVEAVNTVVVHEDTKKQTDDEFALRICFTGDKADCWSIAKKYNTTVRAIMEENDIENSDEPLSGMIVIPKA